MNIGFCGTGRMGAAMVLRLLDVGHGLTVWNRTADKTKPLAERGARVAASPAAAAVGSDLVITMLTDAAALAVVYDGPQGLLADGATGKLLVDMSTVRPETIHALAARVRAAGAALVECPVGVRRARASCSASPGVPRPTSRAPSRCSSSCAGGSSMSAPMVPAPA